MTESTPPPPTSGGGMRYALIGLLLLLGAGAIYFFSQSDEGGESDPVAQVTPDAGPPQRTNVMVPELEIPEEEPDAGQPDTGPPEEEETAMSTMRRRPRECTGNIDPAAIRQVVARQNPQVRACYERRLKVNNILQGTVNVRLRIGSDGSVDSVRVGGSLRDNEVFGCVRRLAQSWRFPSVDGNCVEVSVPFNLTPRP